MTRSIELWPARCTRALRLVDGSALRCRRPAGHDVEFMAPGGLAVSGLSHVSDPLHTPGSLKIVMWTEDAPDQFDAIAEPHPALVQQIAVELTQLLADDPMWIGDDALPLDYSPDREALISRFVDRASAAIASRLADS